MDENLSANFIGYVPVRDPQIGYRVSVLLR